MASPSLGWVTVVVIPIIVFIHFLIPVVLCQNPYPADPRDQNAASNIFSLTSKSDCDDKLKNIYNYEAVVRGFDQNNLGTGPKTCTIKITSNQALYQSVQLQIQITSVDINDCRTHLSIYDGQGVQKLATFDCHGVQNINRMNLVTTGDTVTFIMSRENTDNYEFDIEIRVKPIRGGWDPDHPETNFFNFKKFEQEAIVGMIGGFYLLVLIICFSVVCYCNVRYKGLNKKWETHQLATMKTDTSFVETRSQVSQPPWSVGAPSQRGGPTSQYSRSYGETYSRSRQPARSEDGSSVVYDHDEKFQQRNLMNEERDRHRGRDRMASQNTTYTDDDDDPDNFKEKVITPRVRPGGRWKPKDRRPPSFEEATRESSQERSSSEEESDEETEESSDNDSVRKRLTTSSEGESESETESESDYSNGSSRRGARRGRGAKGNNKSKGKGKPRKRRQSDSDDASSRHTEPRSRQPQHYPPPIQGAMPYGAYPQPGGQFVPVMAGPPPQFQPVPMVHPNYPPPQYPTEAAYPPTSGVNVKPTDPPVYSYLVRRGYTPLDAQNKRNSPAGSVASNQRTSPREEPDTPLQSGVEYMRR